MSIVNIALGQERALVGCDSACHYPTPSGTELGRMSKLLVLQGMGAVMAYRGQRQTFQQIVVPCLFGREPESFDALVEQLPAFIGAAHASQPADPVLDMTLELYVVGWSHQRNRMTGAAYEIDSSCVLTAAHVDTWRHACSPALPENPNPLLATHEAMLAHARRQAAYGKTVHSQYPIGGHYYIADVTRDQILVSNASELG